MGGRVGDGFACVCECVWVVVVVVVVVGWMGKRLHACMHPQSGAGRGSRGQERAGTRHFSASLDRACP